MSTRNDDLLGADWTPCGSARRAAAITSRIEALERGETALFDVPLSAGHNAPATQATRAAKRLGRKFVWRRSPDDPDTVEVKRTG